MFRYLTLIVACFCVAGCGGSPEEQQLDLMNETADILEGVSDKSSAEAAASELKDLQEEMKSLASKIKPENYTPELAHEMADAAMRVQKAWMKIANNPEAMQALKGMRFGG